MGLVQVRLPSQLRHRNDDARRGEDEEGRDRSLDPRTSTGCSRTSRSITDSGRKKIWTALQMGLSVLRNLRPEGVPAGLTPWKVAQDHGRPHRRQARLLREEARLRGASSSSAACGSRTSSTTTSAAPRCASSRTPRRWARSRSARTTRAWAGARSSRRCSRRRRSPSGTRPTAATRSTRAAATFRCRSFRARRCPRCRGAPPMPEAAPAAARSTLPVYAAKAGLSQSRDAQAAAVPSEAPLAAGGPAGRSRRWVRRPRVRRGMPGVTGRSRGPRRRRRAAVLRSARSAGPRLVRDPALGLLLRALPLLGLAGADLRRCARRWAPRSARPAPWSSRSRAR